MDRWVIGLMGILMAAPVVKLPVVGRSPVPVLIYAMLFWDLFGEGRQTNIWKAFENIAVKMLMSFVLVCAVSLLINAPAWHDQRDLHEGLSIVGLTIYWAIVYLFMHEYVAKPNMYEALANSIAFGVVLLALYVFCGHNTWGDVRGYKESGFSLASQNGTGFLFASFCPFILYKLTFSKKKWKLFWLTAGGLVFFSAIINASRFGAMCVLFGTCLYMVVGTLLFGKRFFFTIVGIAFLGVVVITMFEVVPNHITRKVQARFTRTVDRGIAQDSSYLARRALFFLGLRQFIDRPIIGVGPGRFAADAPHSYINSGKFAGVAPMTRNNFSALKDRSSHNSYLKILAETGLMGMVTFGSFFIYLVLSGWRTIMNMRRGSYGSVEKGVFLAYYVSFVSMSVNLSGVSAMLTTSTWVIYACVSSLIYHIPRKAREKSNGETKGTRLVLPHTLLQGRKRFYSYGKTLRGIR